MKKFEAIEVYKQKNAEIGQRRSELQARRRAAQEEVQSLKAAYAEAVRKSVVEGADNAAEIEEIDKKIEQAERTLRRVDADRGSGRKRRHSACVEYGLLSECCNARNVRAGAGEVECRCLRLC